MENSLIRRYVNGGNENLASYEEILKLIYFCILYVMNLDLVVPQF